MAKSGAVRRMPCAAGECWLVMLGRHVRDSLWFQELTSQYLIGLAAYLAFKLPLKTPADLTRKLNFEALRAYTSLKLTCKLIFKVFPRRFYASTQL